MRIAFVSTMAGSAWGGSEELWCAAAGEALAARHEVMVSVFDWGEVPSPVAALVRSGARLQQRSRNPSRLDGLLRIPTWIKELQAFSPRVVCVSQGSAYECVARRPSRPLLKWLESSRTPMVNVVQYNSAEAGWKASTAALARRFYACAKENLFVAGRNIDEAGAYMRVGRAGVPRARVVRNPVNLTDTAPVPWPSSNMPALACVARLAAKPKGQDMLLSILGSTSWKSRAWTLSLVGAGPDEAGFRSQASSLGIAERVRFTGQVSDLRAVWASHHALVLPSLAEGTPLAMVEAMLLGRPVIVTDVGGCADWVIDGENGWLAPCPTCDAIEAALERAFAAFPQWQHIGTAARERALALYDPTPGRSLLQAILNAA